MAGRPPRSRLLAVFLGISLLGPAARADGAPTAPDVSSDSARLAAQTHFERGVTLARDNRSWDAALAEFLTSTELYPTRSATRNAAVALTRLGRNAEALEMFEKLLRLFATQMPAEQLASTQADVERLKQLVAEIQLLINEDEVRATVDGQQRGVLRSGAVLRTDPGTHTLRLSKDGFETVEDRITVAAGTRKVIQFELEALDLGGILVVRESSGAQVELLVDGTPMGRTPWRGKVPPGRHWISLQQGTRGVPPTSVTLEAGETLSLTLHANELAAQLRIEPSPTNATVVIDGVPVGNGIWAGRLAEGAHRVELTANGYQGQRHDIVLSTGQLRLIRPKLQTERPSPTRSSGVRARPFVDLTLGPLFAASLGGGADDDCRCSIRSRPLGAVVLGRFGYTLLPGLSLELNAGYLGITESMTRSVIAAGEKSPAQFESKDYRDKTSLSGPLAAFSASLRMLEKTTPVTARVSLGAAILRSSTAVIATFEGDVPDPAAAENAPYRLSRSVNISELERRLLCPFGATELRLGYRLSRRWSVDAGVALWLLVPPKAFRTGANTLSAPDTRSVALDVDGEQHASGAAVTPGALFLGRELIAGAFLALAPSVSLRYDL
jgi:PEGA domain